MKEEHITDILKVLKDLDYTVDYIVEGRELKVLYEYITKMKQELKYLRGDKECIQSKN